MHSYGVRRLKVMLYRQFVWYYTDQVRCVCVGGASSTRESRRHLLQLVLQASVGAQRLLQLWGGWV